MGRLTVILATAYLLTLATPATALDLYVATNGNDQWSGTLPAPNATGTDGPFATLERARDAIRKQKKQGLQEPLNVLVRGGTYYLSAPFTLTPEDSGSQEFPITYAAYPSETPVISGGVPITGWKKSDQGNIWTTEVPQVKSGDWYFHQLFVDKARRTRARMPNDGYFLNEGPIEPLTDRAKARRDPATKKGFRFRPGDIQPWTNLDDANVIQFHSWTASVHWIKELDEENHIVHFTAPANWPTGYWTKNERYYLENFPEALDASGEWYLDRTSGLLSYWPMAGEDPASAQVIAPRLRHLLQIDGKPEEGTSVQWVNFKGLSFQHSDWHIADKGPADGQAAHFLTAAVLAHGAKHCTFEQCEVAHVGEYAMWLASGCADNRVVKCHLHDMAGGGIKIGETTSPKTEALAAERNTVHNCFIHDTGHMFHAGIGVWIGRSSHNTVTHNEICDLDYTGVSVGWSWGYAPSSANHNVVEYNHIHHIGRTVLGDMGGIYTLGDSPGTRLCHNIIHDVYSPGIGGGAGIYPDEGSTSLLIENNLVYNTERGCFSQHYGRENMVRNNIFAFSRTGEIARYREEEHLSFFFEQNIVYSTSGHFLIGNWRNGNYTMKNNVYWDTSTNDPDFTDMGFEDWQDLGRDKGSILADPKFLNPTAFDFRLAPDSPAIKLGFKPFNLDEVGLQGDPQWIDLPKQIVRKPLDLPPIESRTPQTIDDGFEQTPVGQRPALAVADAPQAGASVQVTDETAATGKRCLKLTDAPDLKYTWQPHMYYQTRHRKGTVHLTFAVRLDQDAEFIHEWRDASHPYRVGPSIRIQPDGQLLANNKPLTKIPIGQWTRLSIQAPLGKQTTGSYTMTVTVPNEPPKQFTNLTVGNPQWRALNWLGFISLANQQTAIYLDDIKLDVK